MDNVSARSAGPDTTTPALKNGIKPGVAQPAILRTGTLQWAIGWFCIVIGALMLVVPHQFSSPAFAAIRTFLPWVGLIYLLPGAILITVAAIAPRRTLLVSAHLAAGLVLLFYASMLMATGSWSAWPIYLVLGLGTVVAGFLPADPAMRDWALRGGDLFVILIGLCAFSSGLVMLALPDQFQLSIYDLVRPYLHWFGLAFCGSGLLVILSQLTSLHTSRRRIWLANLAIALAFFSYMALVSVPNRGITGILFYGGFGTLLIILPWVDRTLSLIDPASLRLRLSLMLMAVAALPLILTTALISEQTERLVLEQTLQSQQSLALARAEDVNTYLDLHASAIRGLASQPDLLLLSAEEQFARLQRFQIIFSEFSACVILDDQGNVVVQSATDPTTAAASKPLFSTIRTEAPSVAVRRTPGAADFIFLFGAPVSDGSGRFAGMFSCALTSERFKTFVSRLGNPGDQELFLVDDTGRVLLHSNRAIPPGSNFAELPPVAALLVGPFSAGSLSFWQDSGTRIAGYAPLPDVGGLVVDLPVSSALAGVRQARELAFGILLLVLTASIIGGMLSARWLTAPLMTLVRAVDKFAHGDVSAPLPQSSVSEVTTLAETFRYTREQVTAAAAMREQAIRLRDTFFSVAAHELKTPLTALLGQAQLLQRRGAREGTLNERDLRSVSIVVAQTQRLSQMVNALLDISRLEQGRLSLDSAPLDLAALVLQVVEELQPALHLHTLTCSGAEQPLWIEGDALRLEQVLQNLLGNAVKYSPGGGMVVVQVEQRDRSAAVVVSDQGIGIPADALPHLFQRFYRAANADIRSITGMGIGLYVIKEIVTLHGGSIVVESIEGSGSSFTILLPLKRQ